MRAIGLFHVEGLHRNQTTPRGSVSRSQGFTSVDSTSFVFFAKDILSRLSELWHGRTCDRKSWLIFKLQQFRFPAYCTHGLFRRMAQAQSPPRIALIFTCLLLGSAESLADIAVLILALFVTSFRLYKRGSYWRISKRAMSSPDAKTTLYLLTTSKVARQL